MANFGLLLIIIGWWIQYLNKGKNIQVGFIIAYCFGVFLLAVDGYINGLTTLATLNLASLISALAVLYKLKK